MSRQTVSTTNLINAIGSIDRALAMTQLQFTDGRVVLIPTALLLLDQAPVDLSSVDPPAGNELQSDRITVPLIEESLNIGKRTVRTGTVKLHKTVQEFATALDEPLTVRTYDIERVILNRPVEAAPAVQVEGDTTIYSLVEEQLILTKHLVLKEEVRITRRDTERRDTQTVVLRKEHLTIEREASTSQK